MENDGKKEKEMIYNTIEEVPKWAKPTIEKLVKKKALVGNEKGELMLTYTMLRIYVSHDSLGLYDR